MDDYRKSLRTVAIALIAVGLLDIAQMIYSMATRGMFWSFLGIFALAPGICLYRGSLRSAWWVASLAAFGLGMFAGTALFVALLVPVGLIWAGIRLYPLLIAQNLLWPIAAVALTVWVYRRVTAPAVHAAAQQEQPERRRSRVGPVYALIAGVLLSAALGVGAHFLLRGDLARRARAEARSRTGAGYNYFVYQVFLEYGPGKTTTGAKVMAWNSREIRDIRVEWQD